MAADSEKSFGNYFRRFRNYVKENPWTGALIIVGMVFGFAAVVVASVFTGGGVAALIAGGAGATFLGLGIGTCFGTAAALLLSSWFCFNNVKSRLDKINTEMAATEKLAPIPGKDSPFMKVDSQEVTVRSRTNSAGPVLFGSPKPKGTQEDDKKKVTTQKVTPLGNKSSS